MSTPNAKIMSDPTGFVPSSFTSTMSCAKIPCPSFLEHRVPHADWLSVQLGRVGGGGVHPGSRGTLQPSLKNQICTMMIDISSPQASCTWRSWRRIPATFTD
ncbi:hypothetical protein BDW62DRAFT_94737 [Aspergillus aurantiobrunneus]